MSAIALALSNCIAPSSMRFYAETFTQWSKQEEHTWFR